MRQTDSRKIAAAGVVVAAVLASSLVMPTVGHLSTMDSAWLAAVIMCLPTAAVLAATGFRQYGLARSIVVAVVIMAITFVVTWVMTVFAVASALGGSALSLGLSVALYVIPAASVLILGFLALKVLPARSAPVRQFEHTVGG
jgi:lysylphosphatidylglycerol synthetase-like protein (DUF2156 family)